MTHIFFSGIGGAGIGPLAIIAKQAGYQVSGSDRAHGLSIDYLKSIGIDQIIIGQNEENISAVHAKNPIDWFVYSSAILFNPTEHPELKFAKTNRIKHSKRDEFLSDLIKEKKLKLLAIAGTHGKTSTTAIAIWLAKELKLSISYLVGSKIPFGEPGAYDQKSEWFIYECDEFDYNFLAFRPDIALIPGVSWDHQEIFPTQESYNQAFEKFFNQCLQINCWQEEARRFKLDHNPKNKILNAKDPEINKIKLAGAPMRMNAWLAISAIEKITAAPKELLIEIAARYPGAGRRMEKLKENLFSDYAHTIEKIAGCINIALELKKENQKLIVVYEPHSNIRQHYVKEQYYNLFNGADKIYWLPTFLAREVKNIDTYSPAQLITYLKTPEIAETTELSQGLKEKLESHLKSDDLVICIGAGGAKSLDEWIRGNL
ncbi:MAG TPA: Mur ligase domain-containing protein [Oligoflexia bacterium]|nr:Mur ligase domain-containing protein [Oligoflexia bacterium]HMP27624.1 Mur ligase domain-containing protein [Oligoflexia bacterium]